MVTIHTKDTLPPSVYDDINLLGGSWERLKPKKRRQLFWRLFQTLQGVCVCVVVVGCVCVCVCVRVCLFVCAHARVCRAVSVSPKLRPGTHTHTHTHTHPI